MKTKISFLAVILMSLTIFGNAQSYERSKISFAILGGVNFQSMNDKNAANNMDYQMITGYHIGVNAQIPIVPEFFFQPGLQLTTKGAKSTYGSISTTVHLTYIELPLNLVYKGLLGTGYVMVGFGPYFSYGIGGKVLTKGESISSESKIEFTNTVEITDPITVPYYKPIDIGGNIFAGYEMAMGIFAQLNTQLGMVNIIPEDHRIGGNTSTIKHIGFGLSVGYRF